MTLIAANNKEEVTLTLKALIMVYGKRSYEISNITIVERGKVSRRTNAGRHAARIGRRNIWPELSCVVSIMKTT